MKKTIKAWAALEGKNIMWVGCDGGDHLEVFPQKRLAVREFSRGNFRQIIVPVTITYQLPKVTPKKKK